ncbi:MAG: pyridoxal phosphate-dependent aminotransferase [Syntrophobacterales bacterium]|nr:pyridoxal phosphate-dependent aminotransferase [Syntrophobacterales bacterium]
MKLARRISEVRPSATLSINAKAQELRRRGVKIINFAVGEPDFHTPVHVKQMAIQAVIRNQTRYTPASGMQELKEAVCRWVESYYGLQYNTSNVLISCGGKHALYNVFQAILDPGDEVFIPAPYWVSYPDMVVLAGGVPLIVSMSFENNYKLTPEVLKSTINQNTKAIILNSPSNPTGVYYSEEELKELAEVLKGYPDLWIISDDIYSHMLFNGAKWTNIVVVEPSFRDRTVIIHGVSKSYAMTGWRIGFAVGSEELIKAASKIQSQSTSNPCSIAQWASLAALMGDQSDVDRMAKSFESRCAYVTHRLRSIPGIRFVEPQGAFYIFPDVSAFYGKSYGHKVVNDSLSMADYLMDEAHIAVVPGIAFGDDRCIRLSYALSMKDLEEGCNRLESALRALK